MRRMFFRLAAVLAFAKSTNVSAGQSRVRSSSRVTSSLGLLSRTARISKGWPTSLIREPNFHSSWVCRSTSKGPKRARSEPFPVICGHSGFGIVPQFTSGDPSLFQWTVE
jgi:hypothetical protein